MSPRRSCLCCPEAERTQLLDTFNATEMPYPHDRTLQTLIEEQVAGGPERIAAVHRERSITYAQLDCEAARLARRLRAMGVGRGHFVGILDERGIDFLTAMVAILKAGAAFIPIDPGYPEERVRHMVSDSAVAVLITRSTVLARFNLKGEGARRCATSCCSTSTGADDVTGGVARAAD